MDLGNEDMKEVLEAVVDNPILSMVEVIIPAKNESEGLKLILPKLVKLLNPGQIIVVNDGSVDETHNVCQAFRVREVVHPYSKGNGAAIKSGARAASAEILVFMDADGQHDPRDIPNLVRRLKSGFDMVVGARTPDSNAGFVRRFGNILYNWFASWMTGHQIQDLTSGFRVARADRFKEFLFLLPNGFSYPTTITMAMIRTGYSVSYYPIVAGKRLGKSHINVAKDGLRFLLIIFKIGALFSPFKIFFPVSLFFGASGLGYYLYTFLDAGRFTNMSALLLINAVTVFLIGLVSEQITMLIYRKQE